jgi:hypothetical protein
VLGNSQTFQREFRSQNTGEALAKPLGRQSGTGILPVIHGRDAHATRGFARASGVRMRRETEIEIAIGVEILAFSSISVPIPIWIPIAAVIIRIAGRGGDQQF